MPSDDRNLIPTVSQVCSLHSPLEKDLEDFSAGHCRSIEIWLTKLENYVAANSVEKFRDLCAELEVTTPVASFHGGLLESQGERRKEAWDHFKRRLDLCGLAKIPTIVVACDVAAPLSEQVLERVQVSLQQLATEVGLRGLRAALEFQATSAIGNNLQTAVALVTDVGSPHLGVCLDAYHYHVGPSKPEDLGYLTKDNLLHVQVCDVADVARELASDSMRILPGEGEIALPAIIDRLKQIGYTGCVSLELMNPQLWQVPPRQMGEIGITSVRKLLGQNTM